MITDLESEHCSVHEKGLVANNCIDGDEWPMLKARLHMNFRMFKEGLKRRLNINSKRSLIPFIFYLAFLQPSEPAQVDDIRGPVKPRTITSSLHVILLNVSNIQIHWIKRFYWSKYHKYFGEEGGNYSNLIL